MNSKLLKNIEIKICMKLLIVRYHFIIIILLKPHLVCTSFGIYTPWPKVFEHLNIAIENNIKRVYL